MKKKFSRRLIINALISIIWLINGLFCKLLNLVPRHREIVFAITGSDHASLLTKMIGIGEIIIFIWILSGYKRKFCAVVQITLIITMNVTEFFLAPQLLLFGRLNLILALILSIVIYLNNLITHPKEK